MRETYFDPRKFIDREFERELFEGLLQFKDERRILAICDSGGMGKTQLLHYLDYRCRTVQPCTPVSLIALDKLKAPNPLTLIKKIAQELAHHIDLQFTNFNTLYTARVSGDFGPIRSAVYLMGSDFIEAQNVRIASDMINIDPDKVTIVASHFENPTPEQLAIADEVCIRAFFDDLKQICAERPIVIMLDSFERCADELKKWIVGYLMERYFFDLENRPARLILVLAGREIPEFEMNRSPEDCEATVRVVKSLGRWNKKHIEEMLQIHSFDYKPELVEVLYAMIERGMPPSQVVQISQMMFIMPRNS